MALLAGPASAEVDPGVSTGDIRFVVDAASFHRTAEGSLEEIYILIQSEDLYFEPGDAGGPQAEVRVRFRIDSWPDGDPILDRKMDAVLVMQEGTGTFTDLQLLQNSFIVPPGHYRLTVDVEDRKTLGFGFFHLFGRNPKRGKAVCYFEARRFQPGVLEISDIQFARSVEEGGDAEFSKGGREVIPQPNHLYGVIMPELSFYYEIYDLADARDPGGEGYQVKHRIRDSRGGTVAERELALSSHGKGGRFRRTASIDLADLPAGRYDLEVLVASREREERALAEGRFLVIWKKSDVAEQDWSKRAPAWNSDDRSDDELIEEMRALLSQGEIEQLKKMSSPERREWIEIYWQDRDPSPGTELNELREEHYRRIRLANQRFGAIREKGLETDRGRIYVRYGDPDEIRVGFADQGYIPGSQSFTGRDILGESGLSRGGFNVQEKAYEVWTYTERGNILGDRGKVSGGLGMRFVFIDVEGYGNYRLVESSELSAY